MVHKSVRKDSVVKIDSVLLNRIDKFIKKQENRLKFVNKKHFIDVIVSEYLKEKEDKNI